MYKKIIIGVSLISISVMLFLLVPGSFTKDKIVEQVENLQLKQKSTNLEIMPKSNEPVPKSLKPKLLLLSKDLKPFQLTEEPALSLKPVNVYETSKSIYQEILGIIKDLITLTGTIVGLLVAIKAFKKKEPAEPVKTV